MHTTSRVATFPFPEYSQSQLHRQVLGYEGTYFQSIYYSVPTLLYTQSQIPRFHLLDALRPSLTHSYSTVNRHVRHTVILYFYCAELQRHLSIIYEYLSLWGFTQLIFSPHALVSLFWFLVSWQLLHLICHRVYLPSPNTPNIVGSVMHA